MLFSNYERLRFLTYIGKVPLVVLYSTQLNAFFLLHCRDHSNGKLKEAAWEDFNFDHHEPLTQVNVPLLVVGTKQVTMHSLYLIHSKPI